MEFKNWYPKLTSLFHLYRARKPQENDLQSTLPGTSRKEKREKKNTRDNKTILKKKIMETMSIIN